MHGIANDLKAEFTANNRGGMIHTFAITHPDPDIFTDPFYICSDNIDRDFQLEDGTPVTYQGRGNSFTLGDQSPQGLPVVSITIDNADLVLINDLVAAASNPSRTMVTHRIYLEGAMLPQATPTTLFATNCNIQMAAILLNASFEYLSSMPLPSVRYNSPNFPFLLRDL